MNEVKAALDGTKRDLANLKETVTTVKTSLIFNIFFSEDIFLFIRLVPPAIFIIGPFSKLKKFPYNQQRKSLVTFT